MYFFGTYLKKVEILKLIGDITQLGGIKTYKFLDGLGKGIRAVDVKTISGLDFTVLLDRGMDISSLFYKSIPFSWRSAVREASTIYYESSGNNLTKVFTGGLLTTCGLLNIGLPCVDNGEELGLHGRISNIAASNIWSDGIWENDTYKIWIQGKLRETSVFGPKLELSRNITTWMDKPKIIINDVIENIGSNKSPLMILYHINIGYPIVDKYSKLLVGRSIVIPRDKEAKKGIKEYSNFSEPISRYKEQVFFHDIKADAEGYSNIAIANSNFNKREGIGIWLRFNKNNLPHLIQWKQMGEGEYVCGIEPSNSFVRGRKIERANGNLRFINPGEKINYKLEFNILEDNAAIEEFKNKYCKL